MKKQILLLSAIFLSFFSFAGTKEDFENSINKHSKHKNIEILKKELKQISLKKEDENTNIAKFTLAEISINNNNSIEAVKYLIDVSDSKKATKELKLNALNLLYGITRTPHERIYVSKKILDINPSNDDYRAAIIADYTLLGDKKAESEYSKLISSTDKKNKDELEFKLANELNLRSLTSEAVKKYEQLTKSKDKQIKANAHFKLGKLDRNVDNSLNHFLSAKKELSENNYELEKSIADLYEVKKDYKKALEHSKNMFKLNNKVESFSYVIYFSELINDNETIDSTLKEVKAVYPDEVSKINLYLANEFFTFNNLELSEKYAKKALNDDKENKALITLINIYNNKGDEKEFLKYLNLAKDANLIK